ncbi:MAG TPA: carboxylating nicotinate-nucleotide diphosphorylase [Spirochaetota bacterium]|nr:carboxylating nicotinate-nucleotide diphosphorylase [Spirochaetota bacterium]
MNNLPEYKIIAASLHALLKLAYAEDIGSGDITTSAIIQDNRTALADIKAKEDLVVCGLPLAAEVFSFMGHSIKNVIYKEQEGSRVRRGTVLMTVEAGLATLLTMERTALNLLQRLSGIATKTAAFVEQLEGSRIKLLGTRKTVPGMRLLDKYAVKTGGGSNHRLGLYDMFMIKDNHIRAAGGPRQALRLVRAANKARKEKKLIEVECNTLAAVEEILPELPDIIMLDNMDDYKLRQAVKIIDRKARIEVSGNITKGRLPGLKRLPIDYISSGGLTHSFAAADIALDIRDNAAS